MTRLLLDFGLPLIWLAPMLYLISPYDLLAALGIILTGIALAIVYLRSRL